MCAFFIFYFSHMKIIYTHSAPEPVGPYSQWATSGNMFYSSWQIGIDPETLLLKEGWITAQTKQACENIQAILKEANIDLKNVVKTSVFLSDMRDYSVVNHIYNEYFTHKPARTCIWVSELLSNALIQIEVIAELK